MSTRYVRDKSPELRGLVRCQRKLPVEEKYFGVWLAVKNSATRFAYCTFLLLLPFADINTAAEYKQLLDNQIRRMLGE